MIPHRRLIMTKRRFMGLAVAHVEVEMSVYFLDVVYLVFRKSASLLQWLVLHPERGEGGNS